MENNTTVLQKKIRRLLQIAIPVEIILVIGIIALSRFLSDQVVLVSLLKQEVLQLQVENESIVQTQSFLRDQEDSIAQFRDNLPTQVDFIVFVRRVEDIAQTYATSHELRLSDSPPVTEGEYLFVPFDLELVMDFSQVAPFLRRFERIPSLTHITNLEIRHGNEIDSVIVAISAKVYVQKPFSQ